MSTNDLRVVHTASSFIEAQLLVGLLESEGVTARAAGSELMDEFSAAQRLLGLTEVVVKAGDFPKATEVVAAWRARPTDDGPPGEEGPGTPT
jgi:hypothetical protein